MIITNLFQRNTADIGNVSNPRSKNEKWMETLSTVLNANKIPQKSGGLTYE